jgi:hypothetical protein
MSSRGRDAHPAPESKIEIQNSKIRVPGGLQKSFASLATDLDCPQPMSQDPQEPQEPSIWRVIFKVLLFIVLGVILVALLLFGVCVANFKL